jgi:hypothetical protein
MLRPFYGRARPLEAVITTTESTTIAPGLSRRRKQRSGYPDAGNGQLAREILQRLADTASACAKSIPRVPPARGRRRPENLPLACVGGTVRPVFVRYDPARIQPLRHLLVVEDHPNTRRAPEMFL